MKKDEAIEKVIDAFGYWEADYDTGDDDWSEEHEARDMAIEALTEHKEKILCKDCAYLRTFYHGEDTPFTYRCDKLCLYSDLSLDDYCSRGKRKE